MSSLSHHVRVPPAPLPMLMPTYTRLLSQNELSYFLPSRAYGLNDMMAQLVIRAPPNLISPRRLRIVWAIMRLRHTLLACQVRTEPGRYDSRFEYTPPSSPRKALEEAQDTATIFSDKTGQNLVDAFLDLNSPRRLSAKCISLIDIAKHGPVSPTLEEYHLFVLMIHAVNDGLAVHQHCDMILELMCGSATPSGQHRTDAELMHVLELEWAMRWGQTRLDPIIVPATEDRSPPAASRWQKLAWTVDHQNVKRRAIGGHTLPRVKSNTSRPVTARQVFDLEETAVILDVCRHRHVTLPNAVFALLNIAWIYTAQNHPELGGSSKTLPMMFTPPFLFAGTCPTSQIFLLTSFIPRSLDHGAVFWGRANSAQSQMRGFTRSPMLLSRSQIMAAERGARSKAFARMDDGIPSPPKSTQSQPPPLTPDVPSVALLGVSCLGDLRTVYRREHYPSVQLVDSYAHTRKAKGGILLFTQIFEGRFSTSLGWDAAAFPPGIIEEFFKHYSRGVRDYILGSVVSSKL
ncbi:hypothetical protein FB45DRAFT_928269 [Roridomyces roridus]|uniref:Uncharacterized protein n=1 Tax=Roridomyces roridus TaxID=1738132 RepID=A0AAD7FFF1_9AGAR|nr:hypothetical protein FB45DRAFT_928269 [Roridomyces roridus]